MKCEAGTGGEAKATHMVGLEDSTRDREALRESLWVAEVLEAGLQVEHGADPGKSFTGGGVEKQYWDLCKAQHKKTLTLEGTNTRERNHIPRQSAKIFLQQVSRRSGYLNRR